MQELLSRLSDPSARTRRDAVSELKDRGLPAPEAIALLVRMALEDANPSLHGLAADTLTAVDPEALAVGRLEDALESADPAVRRRAIELLERYGIQAQAAAHALAKTALHDPDDSVAEAACSALGPVDGEGASATLILEALEQEELERRAIAALGAVGSRAAGAANQLGQLARRATSEVSRAAVFALMRLGPEAAPAVDALVDHLDDPQARLFAILALGRIGPEARSAVPALEELAADPEVAAAVATALASIKNEA